MPRKTISIYKWQGRGKRREERESGEKEGGRGEGDNNY
jgi:hypothetical protein